MNTTEEAPVEITDSHILKDDSKTETTEETPVVITDVNIINDDRTGEQRVRPHATSKTTRPKSHNDETYAYQAFMCWVRLMGNLCHQCFRKRGGMLFFVYTLGIVLLFIFGTASLERTQYEEYNYQACVQSGELTP